MLKYGIHPFHVKCWLVNYIRINQHHPSICLVLLHRASNKLSIFIKQPYHCSHKINALSSHLCVDHDPNSNINKS